MEPTPQPAPRPPPDPGDPPPNGHSPASRGVRTWVAVGFLLIWLLAVLFDFFAHAEPVLPLWFQMLGLVVLGFVLGIAAEDLPTVGGHR